MARGIWPPIPEGYREVKPDENAALITRQPQLADRIKEGHVDPEETLYPLARTMGDLIGKPSVPADPLGETIQYLVQNGGVTPDLSLRGRDQARAELQQVAAQRTAAKADPGPDGVSYLMSFNAEAEAARGQAYLDEVEAEAIEEFYPRV